MSAEHIALLVGALAWAARELWRIRGESLQELSSAHDETKERTLDHEGRIETLEETVRDTDKRLRELSSDVAEVRENAISQPDMDRLQERLSERIDSIKEDLGARLDRLTENLTESDG